MHLQRLKLRSRVWRWWSRRWLPALFVFVNGFITVAILAGVAMASQTPFIFPSLGPTAFQFFFMPGSHGARPRKALWGHGIGIVCGYASLWLLGLEHDPSAMVEGVRVPRVLAASISLAATGALMILSDNVHRPAGATTLIVSLGIITEPFHLLIIEIAVVLLILQAIVLDRYIWPTFNLDTEGAP